MLLCVSDCFYLVFVCVYCVEVGVVFALHLCCVVSDVYCACGLVCLLFVWVVA